MANETRQVDEARLRDGDITTTSIEISWVAPDDNGSPITGYTVRYQDRDGGGDGVAGPWSEVSAPASSTSRVVSGLSTATRYNFEIKAANAEGDSDWSPNRYGHTKPGRVPTPSVTAGSESLDVTWSAPSGGSYIQSYKVQYKLATASTWTSAGSSGDLPSGDMPFEITGLTNGSRYHVQVRACNRMLFAGGAGDNCGAWSGSATGTPQVAPPTPTPTPPPPAPAPPPPPTSPPGTPQSVTYTPDGDEKGRVELSWGAASNATGYEVWQCKRRHNQPDLCDYSRIQALGSSVSAATVSGLATDRLHKFKVRATRGDQGTYSAEVTVNLRPAPGNLRGLYVTGQHRQITLAWDPVPNPDVNDDKDSKYHVEQLFPNRNPLDSGWRRLPHGDVTIGGIINDGGRLQVVVSGLTPGESYTHRIKAQSIQGKSDASNEAETTVTDESPTVAPATPTVSDLIGYRGIRLQWTANVPNASSYMVRAMPDSPSLKFTPEAMPQSGTTDTVTEIPDSPWVEVSPGGGSVNVVGLVPGTDYTFSVKGHNGSGSGPAATSATHSALEPTHWWGHQADHTVKYLEGAITQVAGRDIIRDAIDDAASDWNTAMGRDFELCRDSAVCNRKNSDGGVVTIMTVAPSSRVDVNSGCGKGYACVRSDTESQSTGPGAHMVDMTMIFENPAYICSVGQSPCPSSSSSEYIWTDVEGDHGRPVSPPDTSVIYMYIGYIMLHEFGHTLGLPDFYIIRPLADHPATNYDVGLHGETAIMKYPWDAMHIRDEDIEQLDAIYRLHVRH